ncbi:MAG: type II secretion system protein [Akkermansiaceae bacterium]|nr:type II secretion system protein [Armatimonadota bacterium]
MRNARRAYTLIEVMIALLIISTLFAIGAPNLILARERSRSRSCSKNLYYIEAAKEQYALDNKLNPSSPAPTIENLYTAGNSASNYLKTLPVCPSKGTYSVNIVSTEPTCSRAAFTINATNGTFPHTVNGR